MNSVARKKKSDCCGCNACAEICPKHCIEMQADRKGFLYPKVDTNVCIDCGLCKKVCSFEEGNAELKLPVAAYAAWNKDRDKYLASSSGGAAYVLSSYIINQGGVVYGCASDGLDIRHIRVDSLADLSRLQGSKYVQSDVRGLYDIVKKDLKEGVPVLFIGSPCQVSGLKNFLRRVPENLYLVDLICHGAPSLQMLRDNVRHVMKADDPEHISFRKGSEFRLELNRGDLSYSALPHEDMYYRAFLTGVTYRPSCYRCPFAGKERTGDITIGDFWGLQDSALSAMIADDGVSVVLPSTAKGVTLLDRAMPDMNMCERTVDEAVEGNDQLRHPVKRTLRVKIFDALYPAVPFVKAVWISVSDQKFRTLLKIAKRKLFG